MTADLAPLVRMIGDQGKLRSILPRARLGFRQAVLHALVGCVPSTDNGPLFGALCGGAL